MLALATSFNVSVALHPGQLEENATNAHLVAPSSDVNLTALYPSASAATYYGAGDLLNFIASGLNLSPLVPFADNSHNLSNYSRDDFGNISVPFSPFWYECYHWWGTSSDGTRIGALYNKDDRLVEIRARQQWYTSYVSTGPSYNGTSVLKRVDWIPAIGNWSATNDDDITNVAKSLAYSLGITAELVSDVRQREISEMTIVESGQVIVSTDVTLSSQLGGLDVSGANNVVVRFTDLNVSSINLFPFYDSPTLAPILESEAITHAEDFISSELARLNVTVLFGPRFVGYGLDQVTLKVVSILEATIQTSDWPYSDGIQVLLDSQTGLGISYRVYRGMPVVYHPHPAAIPVAGLIAAACILVVGTFLLFAWPPEVLIVAILTLMAPLFSRLRRDEVLDQYKRGMIHGFIIAHPGTSFSDIRRSLSIANGTLVYHLEVLEKSGHIQSRRAGNFMRYYSSNVSFADIVANSWTELQSRIVTHVNSCGGCSRPEIRRAVGVTRQTLHCNLKKLLADHVLVSSFSNGRRRYRVAPGVDLSSTMHSVLSR